MANVSSHTNGKVWPNQYNIGIKRCHDHQQSPKMQRDDSLLHFAHYHEDYQCKSVLGLMFFISLTLILSDIFLSPSPHLFCLHKPSLHFHLQNCMQHFSGKSQCQKPQNMQNDDEPLRLFPLKPNAKNCLFVSRKITFENVAMHILQKCMVHGQRYPDKAPFIVS